MKRIVALFFSSSRKVVFAEDENAAQAMRIAELKWLLREIAEEPAPGGPKAD